MRMTFWVALGLLVVLAGCGPGTYQAGPSYRERSPYESVPPEWYGHDPNLEKWYTPPYYDLHIPH